ncbi:hypothetical protein [Granulicella sp. 5B5]|uniref:hypothetical protein n=1 Tax=Granulicella sp. 5B5 TaxID=1617967 RepID=UPI001C7154C8|nr:hypothetical protein [Granulicella sp. 5B5]
MARHQQENPSPDAATHQKPQLSCDAHPGASKSAAILTTMSFLSVLMQRGLADYLVTGNLKHFPAFWKSTKIVTAREFMDVVAPHLMG